MKRAKQAPNAKLLFDAELKAERVVSILRIVVALGLLVVFFLAIGRPPEEIDDFLKRQILFAVLALGAYFLLGLATLWIVRTGHFRRWMVWPIVTLDCLFMLANTWVGLENVAMPGALTFLLPPTWLVPVVLAFAVLRFNPYLQAYCVAMVATGLTFLVFDTQYEFTPDLAGRLEHLVEMPPNIVRLTMIILAGVVLVVAAAALRSLLHRSLIETEARLTLTRYLPARLAERVEDLDTLRQGQRQDMGVMFVDIRNFTAWAETRDPSEVGRFITEFRACVARAAQETGGMVDKFIGDAAMLLFEGEGAAARALRCTTRLSEEIAIWSAAQVAAGKDPVRSGIGLHWGEVFSGVVGSEDRLEYTALGDTVNTAARLEQLTKETGVEIIVSESALRAGGGEPAREGWTALPPVALRGRRELVEIFGRGGPATAG